MPIIMFGKWSHKAGYVFLYDRVFTNTGKALPICIIHFRHVGESPC